MSAIDESELDRALGRWSPGERAERMMALLVDMDARRADAEKRVADLEVQIGDWSNKVASIELRAGAREMRERAEKAEAQIKNVEERLVHWMRVAESNHEWPNLGDGLDGPALPSEYVTHRLREAESRLAAGCPKCGSDAISDESVEEHTDAEGRRVEDGWRWHVVGDGAFAPPFGTIRVCRVCGCLVAGGPTACVRCVKAEDGQPFIIRKQSSSKTFFSFLTAFSKGATRSDDLHAAQPVGPDRAGLTCEDVGCPCVEARKDDAPATPAAPAIEWYDDGRRELAGTPAGLRTHLAHGQITRMGPADWSLVEMTWRVPNTRAKEIAEKAYRFVEAELGRRE